MVTHSNGRTCQANWPTVQKVHSIWPEGLGHFTIKTNRCTQKKGFSVSLKSWGSSAEQGWGQVPAVSPSPTCLVHLSQGSTNFFCQGPASQHFRLFKTRGCQLNILTLVVGFFLIDPSETNKAPFRGLNGGHRPALAHRPSSAHRP